VPFVLDRWFLAISVWCRFRCPANDCCGFSGARQRRSATVDPICSETAKSRRNLRAGHAGTRLRGCGRADRTLRALCTRGRRREFEERAALLVHSLEDLGGLQLNRPRANCAIFMPHLAPRISLPSPPPRIIAIRKTCTVNKLQMHTRLTRMNVYKG